MPLTITRLCRTGAMGLAVAVLPLTGCLQTLPQPACPPAALAAQDSLRMMVSFRHAVHAEAPETLMQLQAHAGACATHLSSVSPTLHVYEFSGVRDPAALSQKLRTWSLVRDAVPDVRARAQ